jgi:hypothetical protein
MTEFRVQGSGFRKEILPAKQRKHEKISPPSNRRKPDFSRKGAKAAKVKAKTEDMSQNKMKKPPTDHPASPEGYAGHSPDGHG